jgi:integrase
MLSIRKRGKIFHLRGSVRVGRETRIVREHSCGTDRRDVADAYRSKLEADIRHELLHGRGGRTQTLTIADAGLCYMDRPGGVRGYDLAKLEQINKIVGERPIALAKDAWSEFKRARCGGLSPATVQRWRATFQAAINYLAQEEGFDPPKLAPGEKVNNKRVRFLSPDQADRLERAYAEHARPIVITLRWQGLRTGEATRLDWVHVNWSGNSIFIAETKGKDGGEPRTVTMHKRVRAALHRLWVERGSPTEGPVFLTQRGRPYADARKFKFPSGSGIKKAHKTACRKAAIADFHVHDWRHHWACWVVMSGIDLETLRQEGGWKTLRMVERYATVSAAHRRRAMAKLK